MEKLAVMGGTFNPIHLAHLEMANAAVSEFHCDRVLFMTSGNPPHKRNKKVLDAQIRFAMTHLAIEDNPNFFDSDYELKKEGYSYTAQTMEILNKQYSNSEIYFVIGSDSLKDLIIWKDPEKLFLVTRFLVFPRKGLEVPIEHLIEEYQKKFHANITYIPYPVSNISSTYLREQMIKGNWEVARKFIPPKVYSYIRDHKLYD